MYLDDLTQFSIHSWNSCHFNTDFTLSIRILLSQAEVEKTQITWMYMDVAPSGLFSQTLQSFTGTTDVI